MIELNTWYHIPDLEIQKTFIKELYFQMYKEAEDIVLPHQWADVHFEYVKVEYKETGSRAILRYYQYWNENLKNEKMKEYKIS